MTKEKLFRLFYVVPNPHVNAFFESPALSGDKHPLDIARDEFEAESREPDEVNNDEVAVLD